MKWWGWLLIAVGIGAFAGISIWNYRRFMPKAAPIGKKRFSPEIKPVSLAVEGRTIYGELLTPKGVQGELPTVILSHGYGSSYRLTKGAIGLPLAMSGYAAFCFDFCGGSKNSRSSGTFRDMTIFKEREDLLAVIDYVKSLPSTDPDRLYLLGESQGGMVSAITAPKVADAIRAMVLYYPAFCIPFDARRRFERVEAIPDTINVFRLDIAGEYYRCVYDFDVYSEIAAYERPVLILHGDADTVVPMEYGEQGAKVYRNAEFVRFPGEIHGFYGKGKRKAVELAYAFFEKNGGNA